MIDAPLPQLLPEEVPDCANRRLLLFAVRRMAIGGLHDAHAANALVGAFGLSFRRPLVLMRALMAEVSRAARQRIVVAPCCCARMTASEAMLMAAVIGAKDGARAAHDSLAAMLGTRDALGALSSAQAVAQAFADCGRPLVQADLAPRLVGGDGLEPPASSV